MKIQEKRYPVCFVLPGGVTEPYPRIRLFEKAVHKIFGEDGLNSTEQIPAAEIEARGGAFILDHLEELQNLDGRNDLSENIIPALRRLFKRFHVQLVSKQVRIDGERVRVYFLD